MKRTQTEAREGYGLFIRSSNLSLGGTKLMYSKLNMGLASVFASVATTGLALHGKLNVVPN